MMYYRDIFFNLKQEFLVSQYSSVLYKMEFGTVWCFKCFSHAYFVDNLVNDYNDSRRRRQHSLMSHKPKLNIGFLNLTIQIL